MYPLSVCCWVLDLTTAGFYAWATRPPSARAIERARLCETIQTIFTSQRGRYGAPRIDQTLRKHHGYTGSLNRIQALMRAMGLRAQATKKYKVTTDSCHAMPCRWRPTCSVRIVVVMSVPNQRHTLKRRIRCGCRTSLICGRLKVGSTLAACWIYLPARLWAGPLSHT